MYVLTILKPCKISIGFPQVLDTLGAGRLESRGLLVEGYLASYHPSGTINSLFKNFEKWLGSL
jgi:hypothetical protein